MGIGEELMTRDEATVGTGAGPGRGLGRAEAPLA